MWCSIFVQEEYGDLLSSATAGEAPDSFRARRREHFVAQITIPNPKRAANRRERVVVVKGFKNVPVQIAINVVRRPKLGIENVRAFKQLPLQIECDERPAKVRGRLIPL